MTSITEVASEGLFGRAGSRRAQRRRQWEVIGVPRGCNSVVLASWVFLKKNGWMFWVHLGLVDQITLHPQKKRMKPSCSEFVVFSSRLVKTKFNLAVSFQLRRKGRGVSCTPRRGSKECNEGLRNDKPHSWRLPQKAPSQKLGGKFSNYLGHFVKWEGYLINVVIFFEFIALKSSNIRFFPLGGCFQK